MYRVTYSLTYSFLAIDVLDMVWYDMQLALSLVSLFCFPIFLLVLFPFGVFLSLGSPHAKQAYSIFIHVLCIFLIFDSGVEKEKEEGRERGGNPEFSHPPWVAFILMY